MNHISHSKVVEFMDETYWVNSRKSGLYTKTLGVILGQLEAMLSHHNKVLLIRFDLRQPEYTDTSEAVTKLFQRLNDYLKPKYKLKRIAYTWSREVEKKKNQHYHCFLLVDGNKFKSSYKIMERIRWYWEVLHDGSIHWPSPRCYYLLTRHDRNTMQDAIYHISYLAKGRGKGYKPKQAKNYGASRLKPK
jgi:hypothetical protein